MFAAAGFSYSFQLCHSFIALHSAMSSPPLKTPAVYFLYAHSLDHELPILVPKVAIGAGEEVKRLEQGRR